LLKQECAGQKASDGALEGQEPVGSAWTVLFRKMALDCMLLNIHPCSQSYWILSEAFFTDPSLAFAVNLYLSV